jgi:protein TonB
MVYQALLFSVDEKASRVVTQILTDLEFHVELCTEPFAAVKQITTQHYDAMVVDCDNEQNAALLFKSARNSNSNRDSLAVALVQGQGGIVKAFRIGANLVLSKPIHVEQSKGTLRTAKGLLRKAEAVSAAGHGSTALPDPSSPTALPVLGHSELPTIPVPTGALELQEEKFPELEPTEAALLESMPQTVPAQSPSASGGKPESARPAVAIKAEGPAAVQTLAASASAAASPRIETTSPASPQVSPDKSVANETKHPASARKSSTEKKSSLASPSSRRQDFAKSQSFPDGELEFGQTLGHETIQPRANGNKKNFIIAAVLVVGAAVAINFGWPQLQPLLASLPFVQNYIAPLHPQHVPAPVPQGNPNPGSQKPASQATPAVPPSTTTADSNSSSKDNASPNGGGTPAAEPIHLAPEAAAALLVEKVDPVYPPSALQQRVEGSVQLHANIGKDGTTSDVKALSGKPELVTAATAAVRRWKYQPYMVNGQPTDVQTEINVNFKLP